MVLDIISAQSYARQRAATKQVALLRKQRDCAIKIQAAARGYISYTNYVFTLIDIIFCQAIVRSKLARIQLHKVHSSIGKAASCIQVQWRIFSAKKRENNIVLIQAFFRRHIARKRFAKIKAYDACRNRDLIRLKEKAAAIIIQKNWEQFKLRRLHKNAPSTHVKSTLENIIFIQAIMRRVLTEKRTAAALRCVAISEADNIMSIEHDASIILQRWWEKQSCNIRIQNSLSSDFSVKVHHAAAAMIVS